MTSCKIPELTPIPLMQLLKAVSVTTLMIALILPGNAQPFLRNLTLCAKPPLIVLNPVGSASHQYEQEQNRLRQSLWRYWTKKERVVIRVDGRTKDQPSVAQVYYVEPDDAGTWSVAIEIEQDGFDWKTHSKTHRSERYRAYSIHKVEFTSTKGASDKEDAVATRLSSTTQGESQ